MLRRDLVSWRVWRRYELALNGRHMSWHTSRRSAYLMVGQLAVRLADCPGFSAQALGLKRVKKVKNCEDETA
jgi:hypothetical protein